MAPCSRTSRMCSCSSVSPSWRGARAVRAQMFTGFFQALREGGVPVSLREYLTLLEAMDKGVADYGVERFYYLSRACLVKDERLIDKFDRVFAKVFDGIESDEATEALLAQIPEEWLRSLAQKMLSE